MIALMILPLLFGNFIQKWYLPQGMIGECGRLLICDADRDGDYELYIRTYGGSQKVYVYELHLPDTWQVDSFPYFYSPLIWDIGDYDLDGHSDLAIQASATQGYPTMMISIAESPDSFSYPTQEVWRDTVGFALVTPICVHDIDQDGLPEIVKVIGDTTDFDIYESVGNNSYARIFRDTIPAGHSPMSTVAVGDFDLDAANEFVLGYSGGEYSIWECIGNNSYQELFYQQLPTGNIKDCFTVSDADGDGKLEFVVKGYSILTGEIHAFIFEATGDNTYEIIKTFTLSGGDYYGGYSDVGDVDGDGIAEIALEGRQTVHIIKAAGNDSFYVWQTLPGNSSGSSVRVYDVDGNGLSEVIISGDNQTRIYEYQVGIAETPGLAVEPVYLQVSPNPFTKTTTIRCTIQDPGHMIQDHSLMIYNVAGRLVRSLYHGSGIMDQASVFVWDGKDDQGRHLPGGVYFGRLESSQARLTRKIIMLR